MKTGVFFHKEFTNKDWPIIGDKFHNFPMVMERALLLPDVLHVCFCNYSNTIENETKVDVEVWEKTEDSEYLEKVYSEFFTRVREFKPKLVFAFFTLSYFLLYILQSIISYILSI